MPNAYNETDRATNVEDAELSRRDAMKLLGIGSVAAALSREAWSNTVQTAHMAIDTMVPDSTGVDFAGVFAKGMTAAVVDLVAYPRIAKTAMTELQKWADLEKSDPRIKIIRRASDFRQALLARRLGIVLASQDAGILENAGDSEDERFERLKRFYDLGLRVLQLTYSGRNDIGDGYWEPTDTELSVYGHHLVQELNGTGVLIDVSHCGEATTRDAIKRSSRPIAITHAGCRALFDNRRNKSDAVIRELADKGGYFGVFNMTVWMTKKVSSSVSTIVDHMEHVIQIGGIDTVGFGNDHGFFGETNSQQQWVSDLTGWAVTSLAEGKLVGDPPHGQVFAEDLNGPNRLEIIASEMKRRGYKQTEVDKALGLNFVRVFGYACG